MYDFYVVGIKEVAQQDEGILCRDCYKSLVSHFNYNFIVSDRVNGKELCLSWYDMLELVRTDKIAASSPTRVFVFSKEFYNIYSNIAPDDFLNLSHVARSLAGVDIKYSWFCAEDGCVRIFDSNRLKYIFSIVCDFAKFKRLVLKWRMSLSDFELKYFSDTTLVLR